MKHVKDGVSPIWNETVVLNSMASHIPSILCHNGFIKIIITEWMYAN